MKKKTNVKINRRVLFILICVIIVVLLITGIAKIIKLLSKEKVVGNYANMGLAIENNGVIYYNKYEKGIVKIKSGKEYQITDETAFSMNIVDDTIYYLTVSEMNTIDIKSVKTNGDSLKKIKTIYTNISKIYVNDGFIYYATNKDTSGLVKINIETGEEIKINSSNIQDFVLDKDVIYFTDNINTLYSITTSGFDLNTLGNEIKKIQILDKWIYFYDETENALCKIKKDGSGKKVVSTFINNEMYNVTSKNIYYYDSVNREISKCDLKGKTSKAITEIKTPKTKINIVNGVIYYLDESKDETQIYQMYRIKVNGNKTNSIDY